MVSMLNCCARTPAMHWRGCAAPVHRRSSSAMGVTITTTATITTFTSQDRAQVKINQTFKRASAMFSIDKKTTKVMNWCETNIQDTRGNTPSQPKPKHDVFLNYFLLLFFFLCKFLLVVPSVHDLKLNDIKNVRRQANCR